MGKNLHCVTEEFTKLSSRPFLGAYAGPAPFSVLEDISFSIVSAKAFSSLPLTKVDKYRSLLRHPFFLKPMKSLHVQGMTLRLIE